MCVFSGAIKAVSGTRIFARDADGGRQVLAYAMTVDFDEPVAMILPLPVPPGSRDDAVRFIDMSRYEDFFDELDAGFPEPPPSAFVGGFGVPALRSQTLAVHSVGRFVASFVPSPKDFARLDPRFRMPERAWPALPQYGDWGFAVFELKKPGLFARVFGKPSSSKKVHPMAFEFPRRDPSQLFFPTVHVHDGDVHERAQFSHSLYCQAMRPIDWETSAKPAIDFMKVDRAAGVLLPYEPCFRQTMFGTLPNRDTYA